MEQFEGQQKINLGFNHLIFFKCGLLNCDKKHRL